MGREEASGLFSQADHHIPCYNVLHPCWGSNTAHNGQKEPPHAAGVRKKRTDSTAKHTQHTE